MDDTKLFLLHIRDRKAEEMSYAQRYYLNALASYDGVFKYMRWNWAAFLGPLYWLVYRRLYQVALIVLAMSTFARILPLRFYMLSVLGVHIFFGMYGTTYYISSVIERIQKKKKPLGVDWQLPIAIFLLIEISALFAFYSFR